MQKKAADKKQTYLLSEKEKQQYYGIIGDAFKAANEFNGSEASYEQLMAKLILMDEFVRARNNQKSDERTELEFANQLDNISLQFNTVSSLMDHAYNNVYGMLGRLKNLKEMLNAISLGGAHIDYQDKVFVLTDESLYDGEGEPY